MRIVVTGATGFVGRHLVPHLASAGHVVVPLSRAALADPADDLAGAEAVVHLAAIAHSRGVPVAEYMAVNRDLAVKLAEAAARAGVKRFVFISSSHAGTGADTPYGASKLAAEQLLGRIDGIETTIIRPPLVYGPDARANFGLLLRLARSPFPLPLAAARNRRSLIYVGNLVDAIGFLAGAPDVAGRTFIATDPGAPLTVAEIVTGLRAGMGRAPLLFSAPWLPGLLGLAGARTVAEKLFGESVVDGNDLFAAGWRPLFEAREALCLTGGAAPARPVRQNG